MSPQLQRIEEDALLLSAAEREHLVERLLRSLRDDAAPDLDPAWIAEAERRYRELQSGQVEALPGEGLIDQVRQELGWRA
jgi:putative addiction module component (TIGR02574 family)